MAKKPAEPAPETVSDAEIEEPLAASELDERTHAEMLMLYHEAARSSRFGKDQQWRSLAIGTMAIFGLGVLGAHVPKSDLLFSIAEFSAVVVALAVIYLIVFYQFWQNTERDKIQRITGRFSNLARNIRGISSAREASLRRYIVLGFMIGLILGMAALTVYYLYQRPY